MSTIRAMMTPANYEQLRTLIHASFPDQNSPESAVTDPMVDGFVEADWTNNVFTPAQRAQLGMPAPPAGWALASAPLQAVADGAVVGYFTGNAMHGRTRNGKPWDSFTGHLPMVRVQLSQSDRSAIHTAIGDVDDSTTLYLTVDEFNTRLANEAGFVPAQKVHVITPARMAGERFAAVGVYLAYAKSTDTTPQAYLLEAGLAQGGPRVPFYGANMATVIVAQTNYQPTPMSLPSHWYRGSLAVVNDAPTSLKIDAFIDQALTQLYMSVYVDFAPETAASISKINPFFLRLEAVLRVAAIAQSIGFNIGVPAFVQSIMASVGQTLPWGTPPPSA